MKICTNCHPDFVGKLFCLFLVWGVLAVGTVGAQELRVSAAWHDSSDETVELVENAFESADHETLLNLANRRLEIVILGQGARYSRSQAEMVLRNFFRQHPPERAELFVHSATNDERTAMGQYWQISGESPLSLHVGFRVDSSQEWRLSSIEIDRPALRRSSNG